MQRKVKKTKKRQKKSDSFSFHFPYSKILFISFIIGVIIAILIILFALFSEKRYAKQAYSFSPSPLICGTNMEGNILGSPSTAKQLGVQIIRAAATDTSFAQELQTIKSNGFAALIILRGCGVSDPTLRLNSDIAIVDQVQAVFGASTKIYYELGNENDLQCNMSSQQYTAMWNPIIPTLKQHAPNSWFGGPVNYQTNPPYIADFVKNAKPLPDFISWHEYTCQSTASNQSCISSIGNWTTHIADTVSAVNAVNNGTTQPIMITEWNYAPDNGVSGDTKHSDPQFMTQWTNTAIQTLADPRNNVYASMHFNVANATPLFNGSSPTAQGTAFQTICQTIVGSTSPSPVPSSGASVTPPNSTPTPTSSAGSCTSLGGTCQAAGGCNPTTQTDQGQLDCSTDGSKTCCVPQNNGGPSPTGTNPTPTGGTPMPTQPGGGNCKGKASSLLGGMRALFNPNAADDNKDCNKDTGEKNKKNNNKGGENGGKDKSSSNKNAETDVVTSFFTNITQNVQNLFKNLFGG